MNTFEYFKQICAIPRESGNEEGMRQFLISWACNNGFDYKRDNSGNIIIYCPATKGFENVPSVALQGHMDMVCVKTDDCIHDFSKDPIEVYEDGDYLRAKGTSLGADNGIAVAMIMALFTDKTIEHGKLEAVITYGEETGMFGAFALDGSLLNSRKLINLDSEEEGVIYIGCAGGIEYDGHYDVSLTNTDDLEALEITVNGLKGGHSGGEIHHQRINAIQALARMINAVMETGIEIRLAGFDGGTRRNVIPSKASCTICFPSSCSEKVRDLITKEFELIKNENKYSDPDFAESLRKTTCNRAASAKDTKQIVKALFCLPHGVFTMSKAVDGVVETSDNLAIANLENGKFNVVVSVRSLVDSHKVYLVNKVKDILEGFGFTGELGGDYPSWEPDPSSELSAFCAKAYKEKTGKEPVVTSIHAGLECGVINSRVKGMESVSMGPDLFDVHSVNEHLSISSTKRLYEIIKYILKILGN